MIEYTFFSFLKENRDSLLTNPVCFIYGFNEFLGERIIQRYANTFLDEKNEFNYKRYYFDKSEGTSWDEILLDLRSSNFFVQSRKVIVAVIRNPQALVLKKEEKEMLREYLKKPNNNSILILYLSLEILKDDYNQVKKSKLNNFKKIFLNSNSIGINLDKLQEGDIIHYVQKDLAQGGLKITQNAINRMLEILGGDFALVIHQLSKFKVYQAEENKIDSHDVEKILTGFQSHSIWDLVQAIENEDLQRYLSILNYLLMHGYKPVFIIGTLITHYNKIYIAKILLSKRYSVREIGLQLNQPSFFLNKFIGSVRRFSMKRLAEILDIIYMIDYESKTSSEHLAKLNLQNFIFRLKLLKG